MKLIYRIYDAELLKIRNRVFLEKGVPQLEKNNFQRSPFPNFWYGNDDLGGYTYELCRLSRKGNLEMITVLIVKGEKWIQIYLNIFAPKPRLESLKQLNKIDGIQFDLPPNSKSKMRLRIDDYKGIPLFRTVEHRLKSFRSEKGLQKRIRQLSNLIEKDCGNIDFFVQRWYEIHGNPMVTNWKGEPID